MRKNELSPIVLFVYNRPEHTLKTLQSLKNNRLSDESKLFIYADGAKKNSSDNDLTKIKEVRRIIKSKLWCEKVEIVESDENKGLANSIIRGVTQIVEKYGKVIVLEDDLYLSPGFLEFMNDALHIYKNNLKVMGVSGYMNPLKNNLNETFFLRLASCWGWATWDSAWKLFNSDAKELIEHINFKAQIKFDFYGSVNMKRMLKNYINGKNNSWAIRWNASVFINDGLFLYPNKSLVINMGMDGTGTHYKNSLKFQNMTVVDKINVTEIPIKESKKARYIYMRFYYLMKFKVIFGKLNKK